MGPLQAFRLIVAESEYGGDVGRIVFLVPDEFERDGPRPGHAHEHQPAGAVDGVGHDVSGLDSIGIDRIDELAAGAVGKKEMWRECKCRPLG